MSRILLIDDDMEVLKMNQRYLVSEGLEVTVCNSPDKGISLVRELHPDCIVLDVMMPDKNGFEVCKEIRTFSQVPIIFLTGKDGEENKLTGFTLGAEDYIVKPYSLRELKARIDVVLRRYGNTSSPVASSLTFGNLHIDKLAHKAYFNGEDLALANREYEVLLFLAEHPNREVTFEELGIALFGIYQDIDRRSVIVNVSRLRKKFEGKYELENMIETVWSKGYCFVPK